MRKSASVISDRFLERVMSLDRYLQKIESLYGLGHITQQDAERAYRGAYLEFHIGLEQAIEKLFLGLLRGSLRSRSHRVHPRISVKSHRVASEVVRGANRFVDWLPYDRTLQRAEVFFRGGRPFTSLTWQEKKELEDSTAIRNALAHESSVALKRFRAALVGWSQSAFSATWPIGISSRSTYSWSDEDELSSGGRHGSIAEAHEVDLKFQRIPDWLNKMA